MSIKNFLIVVFLFILAVNSCDMTKSMREIKDAITVQTKVMKTLVPDK